VGANGHLQAVLPLVGEGSFTDDEHLRLLLPALILGVAGAVNIVLCKLVWDARPSGVSAALVTNSLALLYLVCLLWRGVPDHPIAVFTGIVASYIVLLAANRIGLVWPADDQ
jgi:hypothetical protein